MTVTRRRSETVTGARRTVWVVGDAAPTTVPGAGVPHVAQNRAPGTSGVPQFVHAAAIDDPQCGQNRASTGAGSPQVEQIIAHRVPMEPPRTTLHQYASVLYTHTSNDDDRSLPGDRGTTRLRPRRSRRDRRRDRLRRRGA